MRPPGLKRVQHRSCAMHNEIVCGARAVVDGGCPFLERGLEAAMIFLQQKLGRRRAAAAFTRPFGPPVRRTTPFGEWKVSRSAPEVPAEAVRATLPPTLLERAARVHETS